MDYLTDAMNKGIAGERNKDFTTCGKPKVSFFNFIRNTIRFYIIRPNVYIVTKQNKIYCNYSSVYLEH